MTSVSPVAAPSGRAASARARVDLLLISAGTGISTAGSVLSLFSLSLYLRAHGPLLVAVLLITGLLPAVLGAPLVGWLVDRLPNRRLLLVSQVAQAALTLGLVAVVDDLPLAIVVLLLIGGANAVTMPAASALLPHVTGPDRAQRGYAWLATARNGGFLAGASLSGVLLAAAGVSTALLVDAASFVLLAAALSLVRAERAPRLTAVGTAAGGPAPARGGYRHLRRDPILLATVLGVAVSVLVGVLDNVANVFLVTDSLHASVGAYGVISAVWDVGMIGGAWLAGRLTAMSALVAGIPLACATMGVALAGASVSGSVWQVAVAFLAGGVGNGVTNVFWQALVRVRTPDAIRGRVFAAGSSVLQGANVAGTVLAGPAVAALGPRLSLGAAGASTVLVAAGALVVVGRAYRRERRSGPVLDPGVAVAG